MIVTPCATAQTTLLDVLADRKTSGKTKGDILVNGVARKKTPFHRISGYVEQMNIHVQTQVR